MAISQKSKVDESSYVKYLSILEKHIIPGLGELNNTEITSVAVEEFIQMLLEEKKYSPKSV